MPNFIQEVVDCHLCTQCGTCVSVCPVDAIEMQETPSGLLTAFVREEKCIACGKCLELCPGSCVEIDLPKGVDPFRGEVVAAYVGHARDEGIRSRGTSGGVVGALLLHLLETDQVDAALVTAMSNDGSLHSIPTLARTRSDILNSQGSKYCPVAVNAAMKDIAAGQRIAAVGLSCHMHGLHRLAQRRSALVAGIQYKIGLFCDRTLLYSCVDQMARTAGVNREDIAEVELRSKDRSGWPGEVCFRLVSGERRFFSRSLRLSLKDYFTPPRCRLCFDKMNIYSDISLGDAWGVSESLQGDSVIVARNEKGMLLLRDARQQGVLDLREADVEVIFREQGAEQRRQHFAAYIDVWRGLGRSVPEHNGMAPRFLTLPSYAARRICRRKLLLNCRVAESETREAALAAVRRRHRWDRLKSLLIIKPLLILRRILRSLVVLARCCWKE